MNYIDEENWTCSHPLIKKFWIYGGWGRLDETPPKEVVTIAMIKNEESADNRIEFSGDIKDFQKTLQEANNYLNSLPCQLI